MLIKRRLASLQRVTILRITVAIEVSIAENIISVKVVDWVLSGVVKESFLVSLTVFRPAISTPHRKRHWLALGKKHLLTGTHYDSINNMLLVCLYLL